MRWWRLTCVAVLAVSLIGISGVVAQTLNPYGVLVLVAIALSLTTGTYLFALVGLTMLSRLFRSHSLRRVLLRCTPGKLSRWLAGAMLLSGVSPAAALNAPTPSADVWLPPPQFNETMQSDVQEFLDRLGLRSPAPDVDPMANSSTYMTVAGDSFWRIAKRQVQKTTLDSDVPVRVVAAYWLRLIEANLDELIEAGNPDRLQVGQVLLLPPLDDNRLS